MAAAAQLQPTWFEDPTGAAPRPAPIALRMASRSASPEEASASPLRAFNRRLDAAQAAVDRDVADATSAIWHWTSVPVAGAAEMRHDCYRGSAMESKTVVST